MQSYISVNLESSGRTEASYRKSKGRSLGAHHRDGLPPRERFKYWLRKVITILFSQVGVGSLLGLYTALAILRVFYQKISVILRSCPNTKSNLLVCYTILGAMLFISIESTVDSRRLSQVATLRSSTVVQLWNVTQNYNVLYGTEWQQEVDLIVRRFQDGLVQEIRLGYEGIDARDPWTFPQALMFSLSVYTTIGYSNLTPKTDWGKATTCLYAIFGIPLLLLYMANVGDLLATSFRQFYRTLNRCETGLNKIREYGKEERRQRKIHAAETTVEEVVEEKSKKGSTEKENVSESDCVKIGQKGEMKLDGKEIEKSTQHRESIKHSNEYGANEVTIPISTCLCVFFCYILLGSILLVGWGGEQWNYFDGSYFCFVSLVTIGFSDMVPGQRSRSLGVTSFVTTQTKSSEGINADEGGDDGISSNVGSNGGGKLSNTGNAVVVVSGGGGWETSASGSNGREESLDLVDGQLILCSIYILIGMALMAMCFHLTQERFFTTAKKLGRALHLI